MIRDRRRRKRISSFQAKKCETSDTSEKGCRCRCLGKLHGAKRMLETLANGDLHCPLTRPNAWVQLDLFPGVATAVGTA